MNKQTNHNHKDTETNTTNVAKREQEVLHFWQQENIFKKSVEKPAGGEPVGNFVFYDGPPFATGLPHYGHILASTIKDAVPRFWTMNGYQIERKWGWDCHGLPLENLIEKKLGLKTKRDIEEYGIQNFNEAARDAVMEYADEWRKIVPRLGRFVDMEDDYKTMDPSYTESVWWVFKTLSDKGLVNEGFKGMHICPRCGTTLSNFEVNQGYKDIKDIAVTVALPLLDDRGEATDTSLLVWTTTPWTLPGNLAAAVHKDLDYLKVAADTDEGKAKLILAKDRLEQLGDTGYEILEEFKGESLVGLRYEPPFPYLKDQEMDNKENAWTIYHADYVEVGGEGTGAVHLAPAYGEEDLELAKEKNIPIFHHVGEDGRFKDFITDFAGHMVKPKDDDEAGVSHLEADIEIVKALKEKGSLLKKENITHSYPHCWRCDTPLLNYATTSWFVKVTDFKDKLVEENDQVHWVPEYVGKNRFGKWLENARDWAVSRQRYWGAPLPVWRNQDTGEVKIFGSLKEMLEYVPTSKNNYYVMRHAKAESNENKEISTDISRKDPLTKEGKKQIEERLAELKDKDIDLIITSPFERTKETAEIIRQELGLGEDQLLEDKRFIELQVGEDLEGKTWADHSALYESFAEQFSKHIEGVPENRLDVHKRVGEMLYEVEAKYKNKNILFVGHASSTFAMRYAATGARIEDLNDWQKELWLKNAELIELDFTPLPHNDHYELDFHRPYIDEIELYDGETKLERVPDVFDCWFESGAMPYGQHHYPFENKDRFESQLFPANFIAEGLDQTRGWFYSLIVLGTALFKKSPYQNVIVNGTVLAEDGQKMSKSLQNYPDPMEIVDKYGADSMRLYLLSSPVMKAEDLNLSEDGIKELQRKNIERLHNVLSMYEMYAGDNKEASDQSDQLLDQWILARCRQLVSEATKGYKNYELDRATKPISEFIEDLSVWYLRRSRDRLKSEDVEDANKALQTIRYVLRQLALVMAPAMPFYSDYLWQKIKSESDAESVHLSAWPEAKEVDFELLDKMARVRELISNALEARAKAGIKVRQPLRELKVKDTNLAELPEYMALVKDEVNIKEVSGDASLETETWLDTEITETLKREGVARDFIRAVQDMRKKQGLKPEDRINLVVSTDSEGEDLLEEFKSNITRTVGADSISYSKVTGEELDVGDYHFTVHMDFL